MNTMAKGLVIGAAAGGALLVGTNQLATDERQAELKEDGRDVLGRSEARANLAPLALMGASAIGAGYLRRGALGTTLGPAVAFGAVALVASAGVSTLVNSGSNPSGYMAATGLMGAAALGGYALGVADRVPVRLAKGTGIVLAVAGAALLAPSVASKVGDVIGRGRESLAAADE